MLHPKKVGTLKLSGSDEEKQTNEIRIAAPMLDAIEIKGRTITTDALLTQRKLARYLVRDRGAHYHFTVKGNQSLLLEAIALYFQSHAGVADFSHTGNGEHGFAVNAWNQQYGQLDESLAIDGKTMCNAIDESGRQTHIMSVIGHRSAQCYTQKKSAHSS